MIRNYLKIAWRNLWKSKSFSLINILGLSMGMACSLMIYLWIEDEYKKNKFHDNSKDLYAIYERQYHDGKIDTHFSTPALMADEMKRVLPEVKYACGVEWDYRYTFQVNDKINKVVGCYAGDDFFRMFSYPILQGTAQTALTNPTGIAISRNMAEMFFGSPQKAIGKAIRYENRENLVVSAVFENVPAAASEKFDYVLSWDTFLKENEWAKDWGNNSPFTYVQLRNDAKPAQFEAKIERFLDNLNKDQNKAFYIRLSMQNFGDTYLYNNFKNGQQAGGRVDYLRLFSIVAIFILLIACINFMNLATARSAKRAKEVGVRKVMGAVRFALIRQFIGEAVLLTFFSTIITVFAVYFLLPYFNTLTGKQMSLPIDQPFFALGIIGLLLFTGVLAGSYPAFFLSSLSPIRVLKGSLKFSANASFLRKGLVVFQFVLSIVFMIGMVVVYQQVEYLQTENIGYNRENLISIPLEGDLVVKYDSFKEEALKANGIKSMSSISQNPTSIRNSTGGLNWVGKDPNVNIQFTFAFINYDWVKTMDLKMAYGRDFSRTFSTDSVGLIINEAALKRINYKNPIDQPLTMWGRKGKIVGVLKDFHFTSLHEDIKPLVIRLEPTINDGNILIRTEKGKTKEAIDNLERLFKDFNPNFPFTYKFVDEEYAKLYKSEQMVSRLSGYFALLAIVISCLGLFGLAAFTAEQRTKEIGIRKVLGASVGSIVGMLSGDFVKLVLIAAVVAFPIAGWVMTDWLKNFAYRIDIGIPIYIIAGVAAALIALLTVSYQAIKAALMNPVKSLKTE
ncbi:ABC transporter permease [Emticicia sp. BO119]|uniref:ABC transporter permease n=1 Tax=Emticicia sp. BO119 TaxID=2757768 RepID=UPI0015F11562|nr:ABC transporter permease [Emticicia sp. BO119]MBA4850878.1 ABC transporter permease [Emticicia sp. BO119]